MEGAEVAGVCIAAVLTAPLIVLRSCLCPAVHDRGSKGRKGTDGGTEQGGESCIHVPSLLVTSLIQYVGPSLLTSRYNSRGAI